MSILKFVVCKETASMCEAVAGVPWIERAEDMPRLHSPVCSIRKVCCIPDKGADIYHGRPKQAKLGLYVS